jgi:hypothetical protein
VLRYSERLAAEKFAHAACYLDVVGDPGATKGEPKPCVHLMTGTVRPHGPPHAATTETRRGAQAYLYAADGSFCCRSTGSPEDLSPPTSHFMDKMTVDASRTNVTTAYYDGAAIWRTMKLDKGELVQAFWYATAPDGRPLQQGEGGYAPGDKSGHGNLVWHEYNLSSFLPPPSPFPASTFAVPAACAATQARCAFP